MASRRLIVLLLLAALVSSACGARLSPDQREQAIEAISGGGGATDGGGGPSAAAPSARSNASNQNSGAPGGSAGGSSGGPAASSAGVAGSGGQQATDAAAQQSAGGEQAANGGEQCQPGPSNDVGVKDDRIVIATISDITGPVPGIFKSTHQAVQAYAAMVNSQGGVCGRGLDVKLYDSKSDSGENRAAVLQACKEAFALVGSMSAFDDAGAAAVDQCGVPEISSTVTSQQRIDAEWIYPAFPNRPDLLAIGNAKYIADTHAKAAKNAAILWLNAAVTRNNARSRKAAWEQAGFNFIYEREVQVLEANYTPFILEMQDAGVEYVTMVADNNNIARLMKAAQQQGWEPEVWDWDSVAYDPKFLDQAGDAADGSKVFMATAMFEEASGNPEMQTYLEWLGRVAPGSEPDFFGELAWSAAALFVEKMREIGGGPTREKLRSALQSTGEWNGNGLHGAHQIGKKIPTTCFLTMQIRGGEFVREHPKQAGTWDCDRAGHAKVG